MGEDGGWIEVWGRDGMVWWFGEGWIWRVVGLWKGGGGRGWGWCWCGRGVEVEVGV